MADKVWDASLNNDKSVIAYYTVNSDNGLYNVVIGGYGRVQFPPNSSYLFSDYTNIETIDFGNYIDTSKVTDMKRMFSNCLGLTSLDLSSFTNQISVDHSIITKTNSMFYGCSKLEELHLEKWNFEGDGNVTLDMTGVPETANVYIAKEQVNNYDAFVGYKCNIIGV